MGALTDLRIVIQTELANDLGIEFHGGAQTGPIEDRDAGFVWINTLTSDADNTYLQYVDVRIRVFKQWRQPGSYADIDPTDLETLAEDLQFALADIKSASAVIATGFWFLANMPEVELDGTVNGVEASVLAARAAPFLSPAG